MTALSVHKEEDRRLTRGELVMVSNASEPLYDRRPDVRTDIVYTDTNGYAAIGDHAEMISIAEASDILVLMQDQDRTQWAYVQVLHPIHGPVWVYGGALQPVRMDT